MSVVDYVSGLPYTESSLSINGIVFEDAVPGYRTLGVAGRDSFSHSIYDYSSRRTRGSVLSDIHEDAKDITVSFAIHAESAPDLRKSLNVLKGLMRDMSNREARIIFNDEEDVFYVGTITALTEEKLVNVQNSAGQFTIHCSDPYKYSVEEIEVETEDDNTFVVEYEGNIPAYPSFEATINSKTGYIGFVDQEEHIIQIGTPPDGTGEEPEEKSQTRINDAFTSSIPSGYARNNAVVPESHYAWVQHGTVAASANGVYPNNYGTYDPEADPPYYWHGPSMTKIIPNSSSGEVGTKNFVATAQVNMYQNNPQAGGLGVTLSPQRCDLLVDNNNKTIEANDVKITFKAYEGSKRIPVTVEKVYIFGRNPKILAGTTKANGYISWTIPKGTEITNLTIPLMFTLSHSFGKSTMTRNVNLTRIPLAAAGANGIYLQNNSDSYSFSVVTGSDNKTLTNQTVGIRFSGMEGTSRRATSVNSPKLFNITPTIRSGTATESGSIMWTIPKGTIISNSSGSVNLTFTISGSSGNRQITKEVTWLRDKTKNNSGVGSANVKAMILKQNIEFNVFPDGTPNFDYTLRIPVAIFEGSKRISGVVYADSFENIFPAYTQPTSSENGEIRYVIPRSKILSWKPKRYEINVRFKAKARGGDKKEYTVTYSMSIYKRVVRKYEDNKIKMLLGKPTFQVNCDASNKTLWKYSGMTVPVYIYGGREKLFGKITNAPKLFGKSPTKIVHPTDTEPGYIQWTIPAGTYVGAASGSFNIGVSTQVDASSRTETLPFNWTRYSIPRSRQDYSQQGKLSIEISGTDQFGNLVSVAMIHFSKAEDKSTKAKAYMYVAGANRGTVDFNAIPSNKITGGNTGKAVSIERKDTKYIFTIGGKKYQYSNSNEFTITEISICFYKSKDANELARNAVRSFKFVSNPENAAAYAVESKRFFAGDVVEVDTKSGSIIINGVEKYGYGALGNDWEEFLLKPGLNQIQCVYTDGATSPDFKMKYREVY